MCIFLMTLIPCDRNFNIQFKCDNFKALPDDCIASRLERLVVIAPLQ